MIKGIKKGLAAVAVLALTAGCFAGCGTSVNSEAVVAVVNEENVPMGVAGLYARYQQAQMYSMYSAYMSSSTGAMQIFDQVMSEDSDLTYGEQMKDSMMELIIDMYVLRSHAEDFGVTLTADEEAAIAESAKSFVEANDAKVLQDIGTSEKHVAELLNLYTYYAKMFEAMVADTNTEVSDEEAAQSKLTYVMFSLAGTTDAEGNAVELTDAEIAEKETLAQEVLDKIMAAEDVAAADMDALAKEVDGTLMATPYTYDDEDGYLDTAVLDAVEGLKDGEMVDSVVAASDGSALYVVRFDAELDREATDAEKQNIVNQRQQDDYAAKLEELKGASNYEIKEDAWDKLSVTDRNVYTFKMPEATE